MADKKINYEINLGVNKASVDNLKKVLTDTERRLNEAIKITGPSEEFERTKKAAQDLKNILDSSWNTKLNQLDLSKVNDQLIKSYGSVKNFKEALESTGSAGAHAYNLFSREILNTNLQLSKSSKLLDDMADTLGKTVKWGIASRVMNNMAGSIEKAWSFSVKLDKSLNDIRIVTGKSAEEMGRFAVTANKAAKTLGASTRDYTEAALIYYQQGLSDTEAQARADVTLKAANVTGQSAKEVSEQLTAVWNGYNVAVQESELYIDKLAAVAASTAADLEELSTGMSKVASAASVMGVDIDQLNAQLATIVSVTRQAPESVGTALRTIYARMGDIKSGMDAETTLGNYTSKMASLGINVLDANNELRDMGEVIEEVGNKWNDMSREQQVALAQTMAGTRQYNNLLALFNNWDMYTDALETSANAAGTLQKQQDIYMESTEAHLQKMRDEAERTYEILFDTNTVNSFIDVFTDLNEVFNVFLKGLGGGMNDFIYFGSVLSNIFNKQIAGGIDNAIQKFNNWKENKAKLDLMREVVALGPSQEPSGSRDKTPAMQQDYRYASQILAIQKNISNEEFNQLNEMRQQVFTYNAMLEDLKDGQTIQQQDVEIHQKKLEKLNSLREQLFEINQKDQEDEQVQLEKLRIEKQIINVLGRKLELKQLEKEIDTASENGDQKELARLEKSLGEILKSRIKNENSEIEALNKNIGKTKEQIKEAGEEATDTLDKTLNDDTRKSNIADLVTGFSALIQVGTTVSGLFKTLTDSEASFEEKLGQVLAVLPGLIFGIWQLNTALMANSVVAVVAGITALTVAVGVLAFRAIEAADKEKVLNKQLKENQKAVEEATSAYNELKDTISNYQSAREAIDSLTEGTAEFYEGIVKSNEEAQKLIDKFNLIAGRDYTLDKNGLITLNKDVLSNKQFRAQQEIYRNSANVTTTQRQLEELNRDKIVTQFMHDVNRQGYKSGAQINADQARQILESAYTQEDRKQTILLGELKSVTKESFENLNGTFNQANEQNWSPMRQATVNLDNEVGKNFAQYAASRERSQQLALQESANLVRGYGTQEQVTAYNKLSAQQQQSINQYLANQRDKNTNNLQAKDYDFWDYAGMAISNIGAWNSPAQFFNGVGSLVNFGQNEYDKNKAKEMYAQNALGYTNENGTWRDELGNLIDYNKDILKAIDTKEAVQAYNSGAYSTEENLQYMLNANTTARQKAQRAGLGTSSQGYVAEAFSALLAGNRDYDFNVLNNEEKKIVSSLTELQGPTKTGEPLTIFDNNNLLTSMFGKGFTAEEAEKLLAQTEEVGNSIERIRRDTEYYNGELEAQAKQLGTSKEALDLYAVALDNANGQVHTQTLESAKNAAERYKFNKAYNESVKVYYDNEEAIEEYRKVIENSKEPSYDLADAVGELAISLKEMGLNLSGKSIAENLNLIKQLMTGTAEEAQDAYEQLYRISQEDVLKKVFGDPEDMNLAASEAEELANKYTSIVNAINETEPGKVMEQEWADSLRQMITDLGMTADQIQELGSQLGIEIPVKYNVPKSFNVKNVEFTTAAQSITHRYTGRMPNPAYDGKKNKHKTISVDYAWVETVEEKKDSFVIPEGTPFSVTKNTQNLGGRNFTPSLSNRSSRDSGGGGSSSQPDSMDPIEKEKDRYHDVNVELKLIQNSLDKLEKQKEKLFGKDLIENLNKQLELLNDQIDTTNDKMVIAEGEAQELRGKLAGNGVAFNTDGTIANYAQAYQAQLNYVNSIIAQYNAMDKNSQENFKDTVENAKKNFEKFVENINRYDEVITDLIPGLEKDVQEAIDKQIDIKIQEFDMEIEIRLDLAEAERDWNEFKKKIIDGIKDDDILGNAAAKLLDFSSYYDENNTGSIQALRKQIDNTLQELYTMDEKGTSKVYGDNRTKALEDLKKYYDELMDQMNNVLDLQEEIHQAYLDMLDEAQEKFDEQIESYEVITKLIEHDKKVISLVYGDEAYRQLSNFYNQQQENYNSQLDFQRQQVEFWRGYMDAAEEGTKEWDSAREKWEAAVENLNSLIETSIENLKDKYVNAINAIFQELNSKITGGMGLAYVEEEWNLISQNADQYLDTINSLYGIQSLENKYIDAINNTSNITAQKQLKKIMDEELTNLRERDKLTEYDIERANKKYEIALKQIALEEAQQNKSQMRLRRDSQGNYRYEFINDTDEVNKLKNDLDDLYNSLYNFDKEHYASNLNQLYDVWNEFQQKMAEAAQINDPEKREQRELLLKEQYGQLINGLVEQNETTRNNLYDSAFTDLARLYHEDKENFLEMTQAEQDSLMNDLIPYWDAGIQHMADVFAGDDGFLNVCRDAFQELHDATLEYEDGLSVVETSAETRFSGIAQGVDEVIDKTKELIKDNNELIGTYTREVDAVAQVVGGLDALVKKYEDAEKAAKDAEEAAHNYWAEQQRQAAEEAAKEQARKAAEEEEKRKKAAAVTPAPAPSPAPAANNGGGDGVPRVGDIVNYISGRYTADSYGGGASGAVGLGGQVKITIVKDDGRPRPIHIATLGGGALGWLAKSQISGYDTGGYTGEWGNTGRLALLHQKELVLNKEDTKNLLSAVNVIRVISESLGSKVLERLAGATANNGVNTNGLNGMLNQNVHIDAQFPNVTNSTEIEDALNNLVNMAAQRAQNKER